jgi:hypothetical protein
MGKAEEFLKSEKDKYGRIYVDINYAIDNISPFLEKDSLRKRKYVSKVSTIKKYTEAIETAELEIKKSSFFSRISNDKYVDLIKSFKRDNLETLNQLEKCSQCRCLNCTADCEFDSCMGCKSGSNIVSCDHRKINVTKHDNFILNLTNDKTGGSDRYFVLATLQDAVLNRKYIIIENILSKEKFILYYYPGISEDNYGEITDGEEFDFIVSTFQSIES